jgi:hypothetical protein
MVADIAKKKYECVVAPYYTEFMPNFTKICHRFNRGAHRRDAINLSFFRKVG